MKKEEFSPEELRQFENHETRPDLAGEHLKGDFYQVLVLIAFILVTAIDYFFLKIPQVFQEIIPIWLRAPIAIIFLSIGGWMSLFGIHMVFGEFRREPVFITEGIFTHVRHPIYLGAILIYLGILVLTLSPLGFLVWVGIISLYYWLSRYEEQRLVALFGNSYRDYQARVPMMFPWFKH